MKHFSGGFPPAAATRTIRILAKLAAITLGNCVRPQLMASITSNAAVKKMVNVNVFFTKKIYGFPTQAVAPERSRVAIFVPGHPARISKNMKCTASNFPDAEGLVVRFN